MATERERNYWKFIRGKKLHPTDAQIALLNTLGIEVPSNRYDAGMAIERHKTRGIVSMVLSQRINQHSPSEPRLDDSLLPIVEQYLGTPVDSKTTKYVFQLQEFFLSLPVEDLKVAPYGFSYHCSTFEKFLRHYLKYVKVNHGWISNRSYPLNPRSQVLKGYFADKWPRSECGYSKALTQYLEELLVSDNTL